MPKRWKVDATVTLTDTQNNQQVDQDSSSQEFDEEREAKDAFKRKKDA
jgi:hypothetical protein